MADLIGQVTLLAPAKGGRQSAAYSGFRPQAKLASGYCPFALRFMCDDSLHPGASDAATIDVATPEECRGIAVGQMFDLLENQRVIGYVTILENLWIERQKKTRTVTLGSQIPLLGVADIENSIAFYHGIGFEILHEHRGQTGRAWVHLKCGNVNIMLTPLNGAAGFTARHQTESPFCLYTTCDEVIALRQFLAEHGCTPTEINTTFYGTQEFDLTDPDGYRIRFAQGDYEHASE